MKWGISPEYMAIVPILRGISIYIYIHNYMIHQKDLGYCTLCFTQTNGNGWKVEIAHDTGFDTEEI